MLTGHPLWAFISDILHLWKVHIFPVPTSLLLNTKIHSLKKYYFIKIFGLRLCILRRHYSFNTGIARSVNVRREGENLWSAL